MPGLCADYGYNHMALAIDFEYGRAKMGYMASIGARISKRRKELGLSQQSLAASCGVNQSMVSEYENNKAEFSASILVKLAEALQTTMEDIMVGIEDPGEASLLAWYRACGTAERSALYPGWQNCQHCAKMQVV